MYEKDGEKYFIVDEHQHFWNARPDNWVEGRENLAKGWIDCFYGYHTLGPPETHWEMEKYQRWTIEDYGHDVFDEGHVDFAVLQSTYLKHWYTEGFNTAERNRQVPRRTRRGHRQRPLGPARRRGGLAPVRGGRTRSRTSRASSSTPPSGSATRAATRSTSPRPREFLKRTQALGIKNIHLHKGPTIWPLDKDAFNIDDVDHAATDFPELNFIVEHVGLPRIEDFCYTAVQEPNVYAGLSVVIGAHMYARPKFFAKVMGELLFWVGEDSIVFGSDYGIWEPKWQVEGFIDWQMPDDEAFSDYPRLTTTAKKKIIGLNSAKLYDLEVPAECQLPAPGRLRTSRRSRARTWRRPRGGAGMSRCPPGRRLGGAGHGARPRARRADHRSSSSSSRAPCPRRGWRPCGCGCRRSSARRTSPCSWSPTPTTRCRRCPG